MSSFVSLKYYVRTFLNLFSQKTATAENSTHPSIVIKLPVSQWKRAYSWGDTHMAILLKEQLVELGHKVLIQVRSEWYNKEGSNYDIAIVFRGSKPYKTVSRQKNIMWNISHPDNISLAEYESYDFVYIASNYWAEKIKQQVSTPVEVMLQCTDPQRFKPLTEAYEDDYTHQLLFIGNSRGVHRKIIKDLLPITYDLAVYGQKWEKLIPEHYIKGQHIENNSLYKYYGSAGILLNDHWNDMRRKGFVSNRIFDGLACKAFIISDKVNAMGPLSEFVITYETEAELSNHIEYYLNNPKEKETISTAGMRFVSENHTFRNRAEQFSEKTKALLNINSPAEQDV